MTAIKLIHSKTGIVYAVSFDNTTGTVAIKNLTSGMWRLFSLDELLDLVKVAE